MLLEFKFWSGPQILTVLKKVRYHQLNTRAQTGRDLKGPKSPSLSQVKVKKKDKISEGQLVVANYYNMQRRKIIVL